MCSSLCSSLLIKILGVCILLQVSNALIQIESQLEELSKSGLLRGKLSPREQFALIKGSNSMEEALAGAEFVQV